MQVIATVDMIAVKQASLEVMDRDAANSDLSEQDRVSAAYTAAKERRDLGFLMLLVTAGG